MMEKKIGLTKEEREWREKERRRWAEMEAAVVGRFDRAVIRFLTGESDEQKI